LNNIEDIYESTDFVKNPSPTYTIWLFNIAMENDPFIVDFPIKTSIYKGFSIAMLNNQRVPFFHLYGARWSQHSSHPLFVVLRRPTILSFSTALLSFAP